MARIVRRDTRHQMLARVLHARIYVTCTGRLFSAGGDVLHGKLARTLSQIKRRPTAAEMPTPEGFGVVGGDGELAPEILHRIRTALHRWRRELVEEAGERPARRRRREQIERERREVDRLEVRLRDVVAYADLFKAGSEPTVGPLFLDTADETRLQATIAEVCREQSLSELVAWQARAVFWLAGECALRRFLAAVVRMMSIHDLELVRTSVLRFCERIAVWKTLAATQPFRPLLQEMAAEIRRLPPEVVLRKHLTSRLKGRSFSERCDDLLRRCTQWLQQDDVGQHRVSPWALAALAAADRSSAPLPERCFRQVDDPKARAPSSTSSVCSLGKSACRATTNCWRSLTGCPWAMSRIFHSLPNF
ncbi:MAG: hypothetical protein QM775_07075 [Pirellulales bacterium]